MKNPSDKIGYRTRNLLARSVVPQLTVLQHAPDKVIYEGWNFNSGNYLFITDTK